MIPEKMKFCLWKLCLGSWTHGLIRLLDPMRKMTYHPLLTGFLHKLIWIQNVGCNMLHFTCSSKPAITLCLYTSELSPTSGKDAELNRRFPFGIDLNKILLDLLKLRIKAEKPDIQFSQHTYGPMAVTYVLD